LVAVLAEVIPNPAAAAAVARAVAGLPGVLVAAVGSKAVVGVGPGMVVRSWMWWSPAMRI